MDQTWPVGHRARPVSWPLSILKKIDSYRWLVINRDDLFAANTLSIGTKAGIVDAEEAVLKAADLPRRRV